MNSHKKCHSERLVERPTRLLCITGDCVKLVLTKDWAQMPQYATLSYCWGTDSFLKLTADNADVLRHGIAQETLPRTFHDAITITREMGLAYIWIDALCIMQKSGHNSDWLEESGRMRFIYGGSSLNIAATTARNVHIGCLPSDASSGFITRVQTKSFGRYQIFHDPTMYWETTEGSHLGSRAWALQERLLAPRTLYVGDKGMFWECRSTFAPSFSPHGLLGRSEKPMVIPQNERWDWWHIVSFYSKAALSNESDRLPALAGIARRQNEANPDEYLAGMWRKGFLSQLVWKATEAPRYKAIKSASGTPSWSWASMNVPVDRWYDYNESFRILLHERHFKFIQVLRIDISLAGPDPYGAVTSGELEIACHALIRGSYQSRDELGARVSRIDGKDPENADAFNIQVHLDVEGDDSLHDISLVYLLPVIGNDDVSACPHCAGKLKGVENPMANKWDTLGSLIIGLVLVKEGTIEGHFRRVGTFRYVHTCHTHSNFLPDLRKFGTLTAEKACARVRTDVDDSDPKYTIVLV